MAPVSFWRRDILTGRGGWRLIRRLYEVLDRARGNVKLQTSSWSRGIYRDGERQRIDNVISVSHSPIIQHSMWRITRNTDPLISQWCVNTITQYCYPIICRSKTCWSLLITDVYFHCATTGEPPCTICIWYLK